MTTIVATVTKRVKRDLRLLPDGVDVNRKPDCEARTLYDAATPPLNAATIAGGE